MEIYNDYNLVFERALSVLATAYNFHISYENRSNLFTTLLDDTPYCTIELKTYIYAQRLEIRIFENGHSNPGEILLAHIVNWKWTYQNGDQQIKESKILTVGEMVHFDAIASSFVIRILKARGTKPVGENPFPTPLSSPDDDLTVKIGDKQITLSAQWLMSVSPVINRMLSVEMQENQQRMLTLDDLGVDMDEFKDFLGAIISQQNSLPNPNNVLVLLKLADYFQVDSLKSLCDNHLISCVEISLIDRLILADKYRLNKLKNYFLRLNVDKFRAFCSANREQFLPVVSKEFLCALFIKATETGI